VASLRESLGAEVGVRPTAGLDACPLPEAKRFPGPSTPPFNTPTIKKLRFVILLGFYLPHVAIPSVGDTKYCYLYAAYTP